MPTNARPDSTSGAIDPVVMMPGRRARARRLVAPAHRSAEEADVPISERASGHILVLALTVGCSVLGHGRFAHFAIGAVLADGVRGRPHIWWSPRSGRQPCRLCPREACDARPAPILGGALGRSTDRRCLIPIHHRHARRRHEAYRQRHRCGAAVRVPLHPSAGTRGAPRSDQTGTTTTTTPTARPSTRHPPRAPSP